MAGKETLNIQVVIANRPYFLSVTPGELPVIRELEQQLAKELTNLQAQYGNKLINQDILAMLLLTYAKKLHDVHSTNEAKGLGKLIGRIDRHLTKVLSKTRK